MKSILIDKNAVCSKQKLYNENNSITSTISGKPKIKVKLNKMKVSSPINTEYFQDTWRDDDWSTGYVPFKRSIEKRSPIKPILGKEWKGGNGKRNGALKEKFVAYE